MDSLSIILSIALTLFLLMDPIGNIPIYVSILKEIPPKRQRQIILRELIIALLFIIAFNYVGDWLLNVLHVKQDTVMIAGGIILFLIALKMIFPAHKDTEKLHGDKEPFIVPLAIPLVAGPAVLATVMLFSHQENNWLVIGGIIIAWIATTLILITSPFLRTLLGTRGILACERLMGLLLTLISVQMFLEGLGGYLSKLHS
jgi:multiple antibiotic resistance protein